MMMSPRLPALFLLMISAFGCGGGVESTDHDTASSVDLGVPASLDLATEPPIARDLAMPSSVNDAAPYVPIDGGSVLGIVELVSPAVCRLENNRLVNCDIGPADLAAPPPTEVAPWLTTVETKTSGDCKFRYPMQLTLQPDDDPLVYFDPLNPSRSITLRHPNRDAIHVLHVRDASQWTPYAVYPGSCRVWIEIAFNRHDQL